MLLQGRIMPGERLREIPLSEQLGISRIPLRLALEKLAHEGFLELRPTRGFVAQQFSVEDVHDSIELRGSLEGAAAFLAAERLKDPAEVTGLHSLNVRMVAIVDQRSDSMDLGVAFGEVNELWHVELLRLSHSRQISRAMDQICALPFAAPSAFMQRDFVSEATVTAMRLALNQHQQIAEAIAANDGELASAIARQHCRVARWNLQTALESPSSDLPQSLRLLRPSVSRTLVGTVA
ncbi:MAG: GntR family transcriptional regulator [Acidobacteriota bacterium]